MPRGFLSRRRWLLLTCVLALAVVAGVLFWFDRGSAETRETVQGICAHVVEREHPESAIELESMTRDSSSSFTVTGTATTRDGETAEFSCFVYSDLHGGWQIAFNGEEPAR